MVLNASANNFHEYLQVLTVIMTVLSVATFSFILPKTFDHFNNRNYRNYKEMLDLRKALIDNNRPVDKSINEYIDTYEEEFLKSRTQKNSSKDTFYKDARDAICFIIIATIILLFVALFVYKLFLIVAIEKNFATGVPFSELLIDIFTQICVIVYSLLHPFIHVLHFC